MTTETKVAKATVPITLHLPRSLYERLQQTAEAQHQTPEEVLSAVLSRDLDRQAIAREALEQARKSYRERLEREGKLNQTPEEVLAELAEVRQRIANQLYPGPIALDTNV